MLAGGYRPEAWSDGPLATAMRDGSLLYLEELNRIPEETLNVLITAMAERELVVPRLGRIAAADGFLLVAAMNPFDAIGTARVSQAIADRICRVAIRLPRRGRRARGRPPAGARRRPEVEIAVAVTRGTRAHAAVRTGSSVRGAIDMVRLARGLSRLRGRSRSAATDCSMPRSPHCRARSRVHEDQDRTAEEVIAELLDRALTPDRRAGAGESRAPRRPADRRDGVAP